MRSVLALVVSVVSLSAAPVPKAIQKKPPTADGVWECVEFNGYNGRVKATVTGTFWKIAGDKMSVGKPTPDEFAEGDYNSTFRVVDAAKPHQLEMSVSDKVRYSAVLVPDGDSLRWAWCTNSAKTITECGPADDVYYYVFKRVKEK